MLNNLKKLRRKFGLSQSDLANALDLSQPSINKYENHDIEPRISILIRMADYFDTSVDYIVGHTGDRASSDGAETMTLTSDERELIRGFRTISEADRQCIRMTLSQFLSYRTSRRSKVESDLSADECIE